MICFARYFRIFYQSLIQNSLNSAYLSISLEIRAFQVPTLSSIAVALRKKAKYFLVKLKKLKNFLIQ